MVIWVNDHRSLWIRIEGIITVFTFSFCCRPFLMGPRSLVAGFWIWELAQIQLGRELWVYMLGQLPLVSWLSIFDSYLVVIWANHYGQPVYLAPKSINHLQTSFRSDPPGCQYNLADIMRNALPLLMIFKCHYLVSIIFGFTPNAIGLPSALTYKSDWQTIAHVPNSAYCLFCKVLLEHMACSVFYILSLATFVLLQ